jgi:capsular polysaccharide biosynthesis protein
MSRQRQHQSPGLSEKLFRRLLVLYPKEYREAFGVPMRQLFGDQCRDARQAGRFRGLAVLWARVLPDLLKTSVIEHLETLERGKTMFNLFRPRLAPWFVFSGVFLAVIITTTLVTFVLPESYRSAARIFLDSAKAGEHHRADPVGHSASYDPHLLQTEFEVIQSDVVLSRVVQDMDLNAQWGGKHGRRKKLMTSESLAILHGLLELRSVRNTTVIEIACYSHDPREGARLANAVAEVYRDHRLQLPAPTARVEIIDRAVPVFQPVRPNKPLNLFLGALAGILLGLLAAGGRDGIRHLLGTNSAGNTRADEPVPRDPNRSAASTSGHRVTVEAITGLLWSVIGSLVTGVAFVTLAGGGTPESSLLAFVLVGGAISLTGLAVVRGKVWAKLLIGAAGLLLLLWWASPVAFPIHFPFPQCLRWTLLLAGAGTLCALWSCRKKAAA